MGNKQTAVEWLEDEFTRCVTANDYKIVFRIAKMMEKEQIMDAYSVCDDCGTCEETEFYAKQYYEETYGTRQSNN